MVQATYHLTTDADGRLIIRDLEPRVRVRVIVEPETEATPERLTLATARTAEERAQVIAEIDALSQKLRATLRPGETLDHDDLLYGEDGLPE